MTAAVGDGIWGHDGRAVLGHAGVHVQVRLRDGSSFYGTVVTPLRGGIARVRPWGWRTDRAVALEHVSGVSIAELDWTQSQAIKQRQRAEETKR